MLCRARQLKQFQLGEYSSDNDTVLRAGHAPLNAQTATRPMCRGRPDRAGFGALYRIEEHIQSGWVVHIVGNGVVPSAFEVSKFRAYLPRVTGASVWANEAMGEETSNASTAVPLTGQHCIAKRNFCAPHTP